MSASQKYDSLLLCDKILLSQQGRLVVKNHQAIGITGGEICYIGKYPRFLNKDLSNRDLKIQKKPLECRSRKEDPLITAQTIYDLKNHLVCPGFVNTHTHLPMSLFKGLADNLPLKQWLEDYIFPLEANLVDQEFVKVGTELALVELISSGVTSLSDMYFYNKTIAEVLERSGIRGIVAVGIPSVEKDWAEWDKKVSDLRAIYKNHSRVSIGIAPHAPYTVEKNMLFKIGEKARLEEIPLSIHVAESPWEQAEIKKKYDKTPIQYLHDLGLTGPGSLFVHCVHATEKDLSLMAKTKTALSYNPESNMKLSNGIAPIYTAMQKGVVVGLGTDGSASNNNLNFFGEMDTGAKLQALRYQDLSLTAEQTFKMATSEGAKALGWGKKLGTLELGKRADIIALDLKHKAFCPLYNPISSIVYSALGDEVSFVMCEGQVLMQDYKFKTLDKERIFKQAQFYQNKVKEFLKNK